MFSKDPKTKWLVDEKFLKGICKSEIVELVRDWYKKKNAADEEKKIRKLSREANKDLKRPDKYIKCSSKRKAERELWIFEGDSAAAGFRAGRKPETQAGYLMRGVPLNCYGMSGVQILKNEVFSDLVSILGLKWGKEFKLEDLNFSKIVISSDADVDGDKIAALLLVFANNWPELFSHNIVCRSISPIIIATKGKDEQKFYTMEDYVANEKKLKGYTIKYCKGLSGLNQKQTREMYHEPRYQYFKKDTDCEVIMRNWFDKDMADERKRMLGE
jgi:DNA gyrase/topoisomerase IV subunit B